MENNYTHTNSSKLKGFTLMEMMISMALISVVILMGGQIYQFFQGYMIAYQKATVQVYESAKIQQMIQQDIWQIAEYESIEKSIFLLDRNQIPVCSYTLTDSLCIRDNREHLDSLRIQGTWAFSKGFRGFQLIDTVNHLTYTFPLLPKSEAKINPSLSTNYLSLP